MDSDMGDDDAPSNALTKAQLSAIVFRNMDLSKSDAKDLVDAFFEIVASSLISGHNAKISGFGSFEIRSKAPRPGRNPRTGAPIPIDARRIVTFHASKKLKNRMQDKACDNLE